MEDPNNDSYSYVNVQDQLAAQSNNKEIMINFPDESYLIENILMN